MNRAEDGGGERGDDTAEQGAMTVPTATVVKAAYDPFEFLDVATKRSFVENEVTSAITLRFLVEKVREQQSEIHRLKEFEIRFHEADKNLHIERSRTKLGKTQEIVSAVLMTIGGAGMGMAIKFLETAPLTSTVAFVLCAGVVAAGVYLKVGSR